MRWVRRYVHPRVLHETLLLVYFWLVSLIFTRSLIEIESPTARRPRASTSTSASTSPAYSSYGDMDSVLGDARLHRPPRRFVRTSTLAGSSSPPLIGTPSPTSPTVASRYSV